MKKVAYKFNDKELAILFLNRLVEMGYEKYSFLGDFGGCGEKYIINNYNDKGFKSIGTHFIDKNPDIKFQLESQWQEALDFAKAQIEPEFKSNTWCYAKGNGAGWYLFRYDETEVYFITSMGGVLQTNPGGWEGTNSVRKATKDEIETALIKEAERRYNVPCRVNFIDGREGNLEGFNLLYNPKKDSLTATGGYHDIDSRKDIIYQNGKWATIVENTIEVNGYKPEFKKGYVKFGCAEIENSIFEEIQEFIESENPMCEGIGNRALTAFKIGEGLFDIETIQEINKRLK